MIAALALARRILAGEVEPYPGAAEIWRYVAETGQRDLNELKPFVGLASEWQDHPEHRAALEEDIRDEARSLLARHGVRE